MMTISGRSSNADVPDATSTGLNTVGGENMGKDAGMNGEVPIDIKPLQQNLPDRPSESETVDGTANPSSVGAPMITDGHVINIFVGQSPHSLGNADVTANTAASCPERALGRLVPGTTNGAANMSGLGPGFVLENFDVSGTRNVDVYVFRPNGSGPEVRIAVNCNHRGYNLTKIALTLFAELGVAFLARVPSKSVGNWSTIILLLASLLGFILILISTSKISRAGISSAIEKVGFATIVCAVIIAIVVAIPLPEKAKTVISVFACLPALIAIACRRA